MSFSAEIIQATELIFCTELFHTWILHYVLFLSQCDLDGLKFPSRVITLCYTLSKFPLNNKEVPTINVAHLAPPPPPPQCRWWELQAVHAVPVLTLHADVGWIKLTTITWALNIFIWSKIARRRTRRASHTPEWWRRTWDGSPLNQPENPLILFSWAGLQKHCRLAVLLPLHHLDFLL